MSAPYAHEKRVQRYAYVAYVAAAVLAIVAALNGEGRLLGLDVPPVLSLGLAVAGLAVGLLAAARRSLGIAVAGAALLVLAVTPNGALRPTPVDYALGLLFGLAALAAVELVHMTVRYERAHRAVERDNVPEEHVNRVTDEALKTLAARSALAVAGAGALVAIAFLLAQVGPLAWREALETTAPIGVAVTAIAVLVPISLYILLRDASLRRADAQTPESAPDVAE